MTVLDEVALENAGDSPVYNITEAWKMVREATVLNKTTLLSETEFKLDFEGLADFKLDFEGFKPRDFAYSVTNEAVV